MLKAVVEECNLDRDAKAALLKIMRKFRKRRERRNQYIHSIWLLPQDDDSLPNHFSYRQRGTLKFEANRATPEEVLDSAQACLDLMKEIQDFFNTCEAS